jgi:hypothetical protein
VIARIASWDWPDRWPQLLVQLLSNSINTSNEALIEGSIRCLSLFATSENFSEKNILPFASASFPPLFQILISPHPHYSIYVKVGRKPSFLFPFDMLLSLLLPLTRSRSRSQALTFFSPLSTSARFLS